MTANTLRPVLMLGGYGSLGARTTRMLRRLHPDLPITIVGRDLAKAAALAEEVGNATAALVDLHRADLGLSPDMIPDDAGHSVVVTALRDHSLNTMRYAQARRIPYVALSDAAFEIGPLVARYVHRPAAAPILMLGHGMGAVPTLSALHFACGFKAIEAIEIGFVFDPDDPFGPLSASDMERISKVGPSPLLLRDGRWRWAGAEEGTRRFAGVDGAEHQGHAVGLVDGLSLWSSTTARSIRVDAAEGLTASSRRGQGPSHEVVIEITGERTDGGTGRYRYELVDPQGYAAMSARGVAVAVERLLGLAGGPPPAPASTCPRRCWTRTTRCDGSKRSACRSPKIDRREWADPKPKAAGTPRATLEPCARRTNRGRRLLMARDASHDDAPGARERSALPGRAATTARARP